MKPLHTLAAILALASAASADTFYASQVITRTVGDPFQSAFQDPDDILGGPSGGSGFQGSLNVLNLGVGGSATVGFGSPGSTRTIINGTGADFIVFENPLNPGGSSSASFAELVYVEVSSNGVDFARFPTLSLTPSPVGAFGTINPANVSGFGGVHATLANVSDPNNTVNPFDAATAGGDAFDLSALANNALVLSGVVDLNTIRFIRLVDVVGDGTQLDSAGHSIYDPTGPGAGGADIDSVAVIHGVTATPEPGLLAALAVGGGMMLRRRTRRC